MKERSCSILNIDKYNIIFIANKTLAGKAIQYNTIRQNSHFKQTSYVTMKKTNRAIAIDHVTLNMYKHPIKSCLTRTPPEFNEWTKK
jgi:hypothetical protein